MSNREELDEEGQKILEQHDKALKVSLEDVRAQDLQDKTAVLKALRVKINAVIEEAKRIADTYIQRGPGGRELALAITNLQQARMWTGEALGELGHKLPKEYRDDGK